MLTQVRKLIFTRQVAAAYCMTCHALFGKTFSVMAGEADAKGRWYAPVFAGFIDWLLAEPNHCANQFIYHARKNNRACQRNH